MPDDSPPRITGFSTLSAEDVKKRNTFFFEREDHHYDQPRHLSDRRLRKRIWNTKNGKIRKAFRRFPRDKPIRIQCALWMRAFVDKHFFPDANHRTAMSLLRDVLQQNSIPPGKWPPDETRKARNESHAVREELPPITLDEIYKQDRLYLVWWRYFVKVFKNPANE